MYSPFTSTIEGIFNAREKMSHLKKRRHSGQSFRIFYTKTAKTYEPIRPLSVVAVNSIAF